MVHHSEQNNAWKQEQEKKRQNDGDEVWRDSERKRQNLQKGGGGERAKSNADDIQHLYFN